MKEKDLPLHVCEFILSTIQMAGQDLLKKLNRAYGPNYPADQLSKLPIVPQSSGIVCVFYSCNEN